MVLVALGVMSMSTAPALAAPPITYYQGTANAQSLGVTVSPNAILNVDLSELNTILTGLLSTIPGLNQTVNDLTQGTLDNVTAPINVAANTTHADGVAAQGQQLTNGSATTTPLAVDAASLATEMALLKKALKNVPAGAVQVLVNEINALVLANPSIPASVVTGLLADLNSLAGALTDTLCTPSVNVFDSAKANFGQDISNANLTFPGPATCALGAPFTFGPFEARALPSDATGSNSLVNIDLVPTGNIGLQNIPALLTTIANAILAFETAAVNTITGGVGTIVPGVGGIITGVTGLNATLTAALSGLLTTITTTLNPIYNQVIALINGITGLGLGNLQLEDILGCAATAAPRRGVEPRHHRPALRQRQQHAVAAGQP